MNIIYTGSDLLKSNNHTSNINFVEYVFASYFFRYSRCSYNLKNRFLDLSGF
jgi:hypothetical protein